MSRTWKIFPTNERVVQDMLKFPKAVTAIKNAQGGMVWKLGERTGRRKYLRLPHHADCEEEKEKERTTTTTPRGYRTHPAAARPRFSDDQLGASAGDE